ncbi:hypothetical protein DFAR_2910053 [Desulfarculales bacterium]
MRRNLWCGPAHQGLKCLLPEVPLSLRLCSPWSLWLHEIICNASCAMVWGRSNLPGSGT